MLLSDIYHHFKYKYDAFIDAPWTLGFVQNSIDSILRGDALQVRYIQHSYTDRWFADPFILDVTESEYIVLVEEFYYPIHRGRIAVLHISRDSLCVTSSTPVLTLPTHLSYPAIWRHEGKVYIYPESAQGGCLTLYELSLSDYSVKEVANWGNRPFADATLLDAHTLFATEIPWHNGHRLGIYRRESLDAPFAQSDTIEFSENIARPAGAFFTHNGKLYRPAQECNICYGHAIVLQEVSQDSHGKFALTEVRRLYSTHPTLKRGMHTFNTFGPHKIIDVYGYLHPHVARLRGKI